MRASRGNRASGKPEEPFRSELMYRGQPGAQECRHHRQRSYRNRAEPGSPHDNEGRKTDRDECNKPDDAAASSDLRDPAVRAGRDVLANLRRRRIRTKPWDRDDEVVGSESECGSLADHLQGDSV
jgi:hypothetical protein